MKQRQIEAFKAIMECGSISKAAQTLSISQPAVSKILQLLEYDIGLTLFKRSPGGLVPTLEAQALYTEVERAFAGMSYLRSFTQDLRAMKHGRIVVGVMPSMTVRWLPEVAAKFLNDYPDVSLYFDTASSPQLAQLVGSHRIDLGIAQSRIEDSSLERLELFTLETYCIMPKDHPLAAKDCIEPSDLGGETLISLSPNDVIRVQVDRLLLEAGVVAKRQVEISLGIAVTHLVCQGFGIAIVDSESARAVDNAPIAVRPLRPAVSMPVYLLRSRGRPQSQFEEIFVDYCLKNAPRPILIDLR